MGLSSGKKWLTGLSLCFLLSANGLAQTNADRALSFKIAKGIENGKIVYYDDDAEKITYYRNGAYDPEALAKINALLRDRVNETAPAQGMDTQLIDMLYELKTRIEAKNPGLDVVFHTISGYRSPETNAHLRTDENYPYRNSVARDSQHTHAKAVDIFVPGLDRDTLRDAAWCIGKGGVGTYPDIEFSEGYIHIDSRSGHAFWGTRPTAQCEEKPGIRMAMR